MLKRIGRDLAQRLVNIDPVRNGLRWLSLKGSLPEALWQRLPAPNEFRVDLENDGCFLYIAGDGDLLARPLYWRGAHGIEAETMVEFISVVARSKFVIDVGANTGVFSLFALAASKTVRVLAIEPLPRVAVLLERNLHRNTWSERADVIVAAAAASEGTAAFVDPGRAIPTSGRLASAKYRVGAMGDQIQVPAVTLDSLVGDTRVDVIKIDVEGAEDQVLVGSEQIIERDRPVIFFECHEEGPIGELEKLLGDAGYSFAHLRSTGPVAVDSLRADPDRRFRNFVATHRSGKRGGVVRGSG